MKLKIAILAAALSLTGCVAPQGDVVRAETVGQVKYVGGTGLVYSRSNSQVKQSSIRAGEEALAAKQANDDIINQSIRAAKQREDEIDYGKQRAMQMCQFVTESRAVQLRQAVLRRASTQNVNAYQDYVQSGHAEAFNRCMEKNYKG